MRPLRVFRGASNNTSGRPNVCHCVNRAGGPNNGIGIPRIAVNRLAFLAVPSGENLAQVIREGFD